MIGLLVVWILGAPFATPLDCNEPSAVPDCVRVGAPTGGGAPPASAFVLQGVTFQGVSFGP